MLASDKHRVRGLAIKKRLREIEGIEELTPEIREESTTLQGELADVEVREAAALASEPDQDRNRHDRGRRTPRADLDPRADRTRRVPGSGRVRRGRDGRRGRVRGGVQRSAEVGHIPMALFQGPAAGCGRGTRHHDRSGGRRAGSACRAVRFRTNSAAAALGILMPSVPAGQVQIPRITIGVRRPTRWRRMRTPRQLRRPLLSTLAPRSAYPVRSSCESRIWPSGRNWKMRCQRPCRGRCPTSWTNRRSTARQPS